MRVHNVSCAVTCVHTTVEKIPEGVRSDVGKMNPIGSNWGVFWLVHTTMELCGRNGLEI